MEQGKHLEAASVSACQTLYFFFRWRDWWGEVKAPPKDDTPPQASHFTSASLGYTDSSGEILGAARHIQVRSSLEW